MENRWSDQMHERFDDFEVPVPDDVWGGIEAEMQRRANRRKMVVLWGRRALAMAAAGLTGDGSITPYRVARYAAEQGYYEGEAGTSWALMTEGAAVFGVQGKELGMSRDEIFAELESGHPIICSMRPGDFTSTGHFIVLVGIEDGKIRVNDPNSRVRSGQLWEYETLEYQINNLWAFTAA